MQPHQPTKQEEAAVMKATAAAADAAAAAAALETVDIGSQSEKIQAHTASLKTTRQQQQQQQQHAQCNTLVTSPLPQSSSTGTPFAPLQRQQQQKQCSGPENVPPTPLLNCDEEIWSMGRQRQQQQQQQVRESPQGFSSGRGAAASASQEKCQCSCGQAVHGMQQVGGVVMMVTTVVMVATTREKHNSYVPRLFVLCCKVRDAFYDAGGASCFTNAGTTPHITLFAMLLILPLHALLRTRCRPCSYFSIRHKRERRLHSNSNSNSSSSSST
jgi:hypothetical protein